MDARLQHYIPLIGRILLSAIFLMSGFSKLTTWDQTAGYMAAQGMPLVPLFLIGAVIFELGGGLSVLLGYRARLGALALVLFLIPTTIIFHNPMGLEAQAQQAQVIHIFKNLAIMGGLLMMVAFGAGGLSLDSRRAS